MAAAPFVHRRRIQWADTDAANIVYTGRFPNFALDAIDAWFVARLDTDWYRLHNDHGGGTPFVHMSMDFRSPLTPRDELSTSVLLTEVGRSTLHFRIIGRTGDRRVAFEGRFVCAFVDRAPSRSTAIPERFVPGIARERALADLIG